MKKLFSLFAALLFVGSVLADAVVNDTVFFVNKDNWSAVKVHAWGGTAAGTAWPGLDATAAGYQLKGADVFYFAAAPGAYTNCIFNNGNGSQTADLTWTTGMYYYDGAWATRAALEQTTPVVPPTPSVDGLTWNVSNTTQFPNATIATTTTIDGLTVLAKDDSDSHKAAISDNAATWTDGTETINFTRRMFFNGSSNAEYRAVYFQVLPGDTVEFWAQSGSSSGSERDVKLRLDGVSNSSFYTLKAAGEVVKGTYVYAERDNANMYITCSSSWYFYGARVKHNPNFTYVVSYPEAYYIKHPWGGGDWSFKAAAREGETAIYSLRDIYGNNGCNWSANADGSSSTWIASPTLVGSPATGDSAIFAFDADARTITITKIETTGGGGDPVVTVPDFYYIKHPWAGGDWTFKAAAREGETMIYSLRDIYGGNGCNWSVNADGSNSEWIASPALVGSPVVGDSAIFAFDADAKTITITKIETGIVIVPVYYIKLAPDWIWQQMEELGDNRYGFNANYGGTGANINVAPNDANAAWYPEADIHFRAANDAAGADIAAPAIGTPGQFIYDVAATSLFFVYSVNETAVENVVTEKAAKLIENGQLIIIREGVRYNVAGQIVK